MARSRSRCTERQNVLVVDEVDDSRVTMEFCLNELLKEDFGTIGVAVVKEKNQSQSRQDSRRHPYFSGITVEDCGSTILGTRRDIDDTTNWPRKTNKSGTTITTSLFI